MRYFIENVKTYKSASGVTKYELYTSHLTHIDYQPFIKTKETMKKNDKNTEEKARATIACGGQEVCIDVTRNHEDGKYSIEMPGTPRNLKEHRGLHMMLVTAMMASLAGSKENIVRPI